MRACVCIHSHVGLHVPWCACGCQKIISDVGSHLPPCLTQGLSVGHRCRGQASWPTSFQGFTSHLAVGVLGYRCVVPYPVLPGLWGLELRASHSCSKHFTHWVISQEFWLLQIEWTNSEFVKLGISLLSLFPKCWDYSIHHHTHQVHFINILYKNWLTSIFYWFTILLYMTILISLIIQLLNGIEYD